MTKSDIARLMYIAILISCAIVIFMAVTTKSVEIIWNVRQQ